MDVTQFLVNALSEGASDVYLSEIDGVSVRKDGFVENVYSGDLSLEEWLSSNLSRTQWEDVQHTGDLDAGLQVGEHRCIARRELLLHSFELPIVHVGDHGQ